MSNNTYFIQESLCLPNDIEGKYNFPNFPKTCLESINYVRVCIQTSNRIHLNIVGV